MFAKIVSSETIERIARGLVALHRPIQVDWAARFGLPATPTDPVRSSRPTAPAGAPAQPVAGTCSKCGKGVSEAVLAYCKANPGRFANSVLCYDCQREKPPTASPLRR